jgi:hypothetical protein
VNWIGKLAPGNSPGITTINGNYKQDAGDVLEIEVGGQIFGTQHDLLEVTGTAMLGGRLEVPIIQVPGQPPYTPMNGHKITFLTSQTDNGVTGTFDSVIFRDLPEGVAHRLIYNPKNVQLEFIAPEPIQFVSMLPTAPWSIDNTWLENGMPAVPESNNIISVQTQIGMPQFVEITTPNESVHRMAVGDAMSTPGDPTKEITLRIDNSNLSVAINAEIKTNGTIELGNSTLGHVGTLTSQNVTVQAGGTLAGNGTVVGNLNVGTVGGIASAMLAPGKSAGPTTPALTVQGNYQQATSGEFVLKVDGPDADDFSAVNVTGTAQLNGTLNVDVSGLQNINQSFDVTFLRAGNLPAGSIFQDVTATGNNRIVIIPTYRFGSSAGATSLASGAVADANGEVEVCVCFAGDVSGNGKVGPEDVTAFAYLLGNPGELKTMYPAARRTLGDLNGWVPGTELQNLGDNRIDFDDIPYFIRVLKDSNVIATTGGLSAAIHAAALGVPEPSSIVLVFGCMVMMMSGHGRIPRHAGMAARN